MKKRAAKEEQLSRLTVIIPTRLLKAMKLYAVALNCSLEGLAADALASESGAEWWDHEVREADPKLADEIREKMYGGPLKFTNLAALKAWKESGQPLLREITRNDP